MESSVPKDDLLLQQYGQLDSGHTCAQINGRRSKRTRVPPSRVLDQALRDIHDEYTHHARRSDKVDFSFQSPLSSLATRKDVHNRSSVSDRPTEPSLQSILASCITKAAKASDEEESHEELSKIFNIKTVNFLDAKGYQETDIMLWHWVLSAVSSERAALRLNLAWALAAQRMVSKKPPIPVFVFLQLLRRKSLSPYSLFYLISHAWQRLGGVVPKFPSRVLENRLTKVLTQPRGILNKGSGTNSLSLLASSTGNPYNMTEPSIMLMTVRLLRQARIIWPASLPSIATLFTRYINGHVHALGTADKSLASRLTKLYNRVLSLIALPSSQTPFTQIGHHQQAQFIILRAMDTHKPPLVVNREGYRGVVRVQLAHRKTLSEQGWADLKSHSWPPWKEDKLGFDAEKGAESGLSRASHALRKMYEAGYSMQSWEQTAQIYTGWDTDESPTIQIRKLIPANFKSSKVPLQVDSLAQSAKNEPIEVSTWAARIRATRTLDEAWACFLSYHKVHRKREEQVYLAMFEKLFFDLKRSRKEQREFSEDTNPMVYPGDGLEVFPKPSYSNVGIYVPTPPPTIDAFLALMIDDGLQPARRLLAFLLSHADSFKFGRKAYDLSYRPSLIIKSFLYRRDEEAIPSVARAVKEWPGYLQAAFLSFVGKFVTPMRPRKPWMQSASSVHEEHKPRGDLDFGLAILFQVQPRYLPAWYSVMSTSASGSRTDHHDVDETHLLNSSRILRIAHNMHKIGLEVDMQGVQLMCVALEASILARSKFSTHMCKQDGYGKPLDRVRSEELYATHITAEATRANQDLLAYAKQAFQRCISISSPITIFQDSLAPTSWLMSQTNGSIDPQTTLPRMSDMPPAATLHALVRVLGLLHDYNGILQLARWIAQHRLELHLATMERGRGDGMLRRMVIAIRVFLDKAWADEVDQLRPRDPPTDERFGLERSLHKPEMCDMSYEANEPRESVHLATGADDVSKMDEGAEDLVQQAADIMDSIEFDWGGWPTDNEIEDYLRKGRNL